MTDTADWQQPNIIVGQQVPVYSGSQYQPVQGNGIYLTGTAFPNSNVYGTCITYTVPAAKKFYLQGLSYGAQSATVMLYTAGKLTNNAGNVFQILNVSGQTIVFDSPVVFAAGDTVTLFVLQVATTAAAANVYGNMWGWTA